MQVTEIDPINALQAADGRLRSSPSTERSAKADIVITADRQRGHHHLRPHAGDEEPGHPGQHRPLDDRIDSWPEHERQGATADHHQTAGQTSGSSPTVTAIIRARARTACSTWAAPRPPSFVMNGCFTDQVMAQIELWTQERQVRQRRSTALPKHLDEKGLLDPFEALGGSLDQAGPWPGRVTSAWDVEGLRQAGPPLTDSREQTQRPRSAVKGPLRSARQRCGHSDMFGIRHHRDRRWTVTSRCRNAKPGIRSKLRDRLFTLAVNRPGWSFCCSSRSSQRLPAPSACGRLGSITTRGRMHRRSTRHRIVAARGPPGDLVRSPRPA